MGRCAGEEGRRLCALWGQCGTLTLGRNRNAVKQEQTRRQVRVWTGPDGKVVGSCRVMGGQPIVLLVAGICEFVQLFVIYYVQRLALFATCADLLTRVCNDELKQIYQSSPAETAIEFDTLPQPTAMLRIQGRIATTPSIQSCQRLSSLYAFLRAVPYSSF
jgi:hypothetical protein